MKINTSVGERIGSPIDDVSYTNSEANKNNGLMCLGLLRTLIFRAVLILVSD